MGHFLRMLGDADCQFSCAVLHSFQNIVLYTGEECPLSFSLYKLFHILHSMNLRLIGDIGNQSHFDVLLIMFHITVNQVNLAFFFVSA